MKSSHLLSLLISISAMASTPALAEDGNGVSKPETGKQKGVEFTKVQDLNPNTQPLNRPVKQKWAVVIGLGRFDDRRLNNQSHLDDVAKSFASYLTDPKGGRFDPSHVRVLINSYASQQNIANTFGKKWLGTVAGPDDLVVVYIATQAFPTTDGNTYLCAYNCAIDNMYGTCLSMQELMKTLKESVKSDRIVLVLEAPYSGSADLASVVKTPPNSYNLDLTKVILGKGYIVMSAGKSDQLVKGSKFTTNLIAALREKDGLVPVHEAFAQARDATQAQTAGAGKQTPQIKSDWTGTDLAIGAPTLEKLKDLPEAAKAFLGAESHYLKASQLMSSGNAAGAIEEYKAAVAADPDYPDAIADYGVALYLSGDPAGAAEMIKHAVDLRPDDALYRVNYARVLDRLKNTSECVAQLERAYALNPKDRNVLVALADKAMAQKQFGRAQELLEEALELYPGVAILHDKMAVTWQGLGDVAKAMQEEQEALKLNPDLVSARINLGFLLMEKGAQNEATQQLEQAIKLSPENKEAYYLLGQSLEKSGNKPGAAGAFKRFLDLADKSDPRRIDATHRVERLSPATAETPSSPKPDSEHD